MASVNIVQDTITAGALLTAVLTIFGISKAIIKAICSSRDRVRTQQERNEAQDRDIARLKEENQLICYGLSAALDGLEQLGANHIVPVAKGKLEKYLNQQAHK